MKKGLLALLILGMAACGTPIAHKLNPVKRLTGYVERASFTTAIKNREPLNKVTMLRNNQQKIYYFTELKNMTGKTVRHRWKYKGKVMAEIRFKVKGPRWRVYSRKWLERHRVGTWSASVISESGRTLSTSTFSYTRAPRRNVPASADESIFERGASGAKSLWNDWFGDD